MPRPCLYGFPDRDFPFVRIIAPRPDLILLDLNVPKKNGVEALSDLWADSDLRRIPLMVVSGLIEDCAMVRQDDEDSRYFLVKPTDLDLYIA